MLSSNSPWAVVVGVATLFVIGCGADDKQCDLSAAVGLSVSVVDSQDAPVCDVTVHIQDGAYEEEGTLDLGMCVFHGAVERAGTYDVSALRDDVVLAEEQVVVPAGECHVQGQKVTLVVAD